MIFYISDLHLNHSNILTLCNRPFLNVNEMNDTIIKRWNYSVTDEDEVYILGDVVFGNTKYAYELFKQLKGKKYLIRGNHDKTILEVNRKYNVFEWVKDYYELKVDGLHIIMMHYPIEDWNKKYVGSIHLHGHSHGKSRKVLNRFDMSVDCNNFEPVSNDYLKELINTQL